MKCRRLNILVVDDDKADFKLIANELGRIKCASYQTQWASTFAAGLELARQNRHDIVLVDDLLDPESGLDLIHEAIESGARMPFILLGSQSDPKADLEAMACGASDYLVKSTLGHPFLERAIRYVISRHQVMQALRRSEEFIRRILESSPDRFVVLYREGDNLSPEPPHDPMDAVSTDPPETLPFKSWIEHWHPDEQPLARAALEEAAQGGRGSFQARPSTGNEEGPWFDVIVSPMLDEARRQDRVLAVSRDITTFKRAKATLKQLNQELEMRVVARTADLERANRALREEIAQHEATEQRLAKAHDELKNKHFEIQGFYHTLSHELKTPLTSAREFISIINDGLAGPVSPEQREYLGIALDSCDQIKLCLNDLLDATRLETGKLQINPQPAQLGALVQRVFTSFQPNCAEHQLHFDCAVEMDLPEVSFDEARINQVLTNLLNNAIKFTDAGGRIKLSAARSGDHPQFVEVSVCDTGRAIPPDQIEHIFDRLYQVKTGDAAGGQGIGLGLYLCRELVHLHGGNIWVESRPGKGSTFTFLLKFAQRVCQPHLLAVEEDPTLGDLLRRTLQRHQLDVTIVADGHRALEALSNQRIDLLLMDLVVPEMDGASLIREVRRQWPTLPIILHTAHPTGEPFAEILDFSPFTLLAKPCPMDRLLETIKRVLKQHDTIIWRKPPAAPPHRKAA